MYTREQRSRQNKQAYYLAATIAACSLVMFAGAGVQYIDSISALARWVLLALLVATLTVQMKLGLALKGAWGAVTAVFLLWCVLSAIWSASPTLTLAKASAFAAVALSMSAVGHLWALQGKRENIFALLLPLTALVVVSALAGAATGTDAVRASETSTLYRGLANNPNFLGILIICVLPAALWEVYRQDTSRRRKFLSYTVLASLTVMLASSYSRASILAALIIVFSLLFGAGLKRYSAALAIAGVGLTVVFVAFPETVASLETRYIYKSLGRDVSLFESRETVWQASLSAAQKGGPFGFGLGVAAEDAELGIEQYEIEISSSHYGREKGNSTLAMVEEVGWVGLIAFGLVLWTFYYRAFGAVQLSQNREHKLISTLILGTTVALLVNAQFEAWFLAPGSAAAPVFWLFVGLGLGFRERIDRVNRGSRSARHVARTATTGIDRYEEVLGAVEAARRWLPSSLPPQRH
jgi:hypothetical protein